MSTNLEQLIGQAVTSPEFRNQLLTNPEQAIASSGITLSTDELQSVMTGIEQLKASNQNLDSLFQNETLLYW